MPFTDPYRQPYQGEFYSDVNALSSIRARKWDSNGDGTGNPMNGMFYYHTVDGNYRYYSEGSWYALAGSNTDEAEIFGYFAGTI